LPEKKNYIYIYTHKGSLDAQKVDSERRLKIFCIESGFITEPNRGIWMNREKRPYEGGIIINAWLLPKLLPK
jgi:hypothetical protein